MKKVIKIYSAVIISTTLLTNPVYASVSINEVMYDLPGTDSDREWIELVNNGSESIDLSDWKLFENKVNHKLEPVGGVSLLGSGLYAVIVSSAEKFYEDWPDFEGLVFDSSFSLSNSGERISIKDSEGNEVSVLDYEIQEGASGTGASLQLIGDEWFSYVPTPGEDNKEESVSSDNNDGDVLGVSAHSSSEPVSFIKEVDDIYTSVGREERLVLVGSPVLFKASTYTNPSSKKSVDGVEYKWSFGDSSIMQGKNVYHTYYEPGKYVVINRSFFKDSEAIARTEVIVLPFELEISDVVPGEYVEIKNNLKNEVNIGGLYISNSHSSFVIAEDTIILPGSRLRIPVEVLTIDIDVDFLYLFDASKKFIQEYKVGT